MHYVVLLMLLLNNWLLPKIFPLQFGIPEQKIIQHIPEKSRDFAQLIPGKLDTYIYDDEQTYYKAYQDSYFAITQEKGGWDCLRHYEILANGCIPYFLNLEQCSPTIMTFLPKKLILEAMKLSGVSHLAIDHTKFDTEKYYELLNKMLVHTRTHLTTTAMARYILKSISYTGNGSILYLSAQQEPDYMRCLTLIGFKQLFGTRIIDVPKINHIYNSYPLDEKALYGKGFTYTRIVNDEDVDRNNIEQRIRNKEFDLIIYGSVHRGLPYHDLVRKTYDTKKIVYICGEDSHKCVYAKKLPNLFLREYVS